MFCKKCGKEVEENVAYCPFCGEFLNGNNDIKNSNEKMKISINVKRKPRLLKADVITNFTRKNMGEHNIDYEKLRDDLYEDSLGVAFGSGFGGAFSQAEDVKRASAEQLERIAKQNGVNISKYNK